MQGLTGRCLGLIFLLALFFFLMFLVFVTTLLGFFLGLVFLNSVFQSLNATHIYTMYIDHSHMISHPPPSNSPQCPPPISLSTSSSLSIIFIISTRSVSSACMRYGYVALHCSMVHLPWAVSPKESDSCFLSSHWSPSSLIRCLLNLILHPQLFTQ